MSKLHPDRHLSLHSVCLDYFPLETVKRLDALTDRNRATHEYFKIAARFAQEQKVPYDRAFDVALDVLRLRRDELKEAQTA